MRSAFILGMCQLDTHFAHHCPSNRSINLSPTGILEAAESILLHLEHSRRALGNGWHNSSNYQAWKYYFMDYVRRNATPHDRKAALQRRW